MKNRTIIYFIATVMMIFAVSCEDLLDKKPPLQLDNDQVLGTYELILQATNAAYSPLYSAAYYGRNFVVRPDLMGNNAKQSPRSSGRFQEEYNWNITPGDNVGVWTQAYDVIARVNNVLEYIDDIDEDGVTDDMKNQVKGECLFLRALCHWDLVRAFGQPYTYDGGNTLGVPIITKTEIAKPERNTVKEVYEDLIVPDLTSAIALLSDPGRGNEPKAFACKEAAQAILAKVYLYMADWSNAAALAGEVISSPKYSMYTAANYLSVWDGSNSDEVIFLIYGSNVESVFPSWDEIGYIYNPDGYGDVCASNDLLNLFDPADVRGQLFNDSPAYAGYYWPAKYPGKSGDTRVNNIPVIRLSEMYLIRAEAVLNGASGNALADYNMIRTNRGLAAATTVSLTDIYNERRRELCFEGNRMWDLSRTGRGLERDNEDNKISIPGHEDIAFPDYKWALPIPTVEINANENMQQNPDY